MINLGPVRRSRETARRVRSRQSFRSAGRADRLPAVQRQPRTFRMSRTIHGLSRIHISTGCQAHASPNFPNRVFQVAAAALAARPLERMMQERCVACKYLIFFAMRYLVLCKCATQGSDKENIIWATHNSRYSNNMSGRCSPILTSLGFYTDANSALFVCFICAISDTNGPDKFSRSAPQSGLHRSRLSAIFGTAIGTVIVRRAAFWVRCKRGKAPWQMT